MRCWKVGYFFTTLSNGFHHLYRRSCPGPGTVTYTYSSAIHSPVLALHWSALHSHLHLALIRFVRRLFRSLSALKDNSRLHQQYCRTDLDPTLYSISPYTPTTDDEARWARYMLLAASLYPHRQLLSSTSTAYNTTFRPLCVVIFRTQERNSSQHIFS